MARYHINPETGNPGLCSVGEGQCPFGSSVPHYATEAEARREAESILKEQFVEAPLKKGPAIPKAKVEELIDELFKASEAYYQKGEDSTLTDEEFDAKLSYLEELSHRGDYGELFRPDSKGANLLEADPSLGTKVEGETVHHEVPMLSLQKAKKEPELYAYLKRTRDAGATGFRLQAKMDGLAMSAEYSNGQLKKLSTRGDGTTGENVTYLLDEPHVAIKGLQKTLEEKGSVEVRGELFFTTAQFQAADRARFASTGQHFKNSRNAASGLMKAAKLGLAYPVEFTFTAYSLIRNEQPADLRSLKGEGFLPIDDFTKSAVGGLKLEGFDSDQEIMKAVHDFGDKRERFDFPTDGVVIKPTNEVELIKATGYTSHHPVSQIAWKYPAETAVTEVEEITITVGKSGKITPVARVKPVSLAGSTISNASLHNFNLVYTKGIREGSVVLIEKANEIIPQVKTVLSNPKTSKDFPIPNKCPYCGTLLSYDKESEEWPPKTLRCPNVNCESRAFNGMTTAVGKNLLDIDGMSTATLEYLNSIGRVRSIADIYTLSEKELADSELGEGRRLGEKRASHILEYVEKSKTRPLAKVLPALNIELLGAETAKDLEKAFGDIDGILTASKEDFENLEGFGRVKADKIYYGLQSRKGLIEKMRANGVTFGKGDKKGGGNSLSGLSFSISGSVPPGFGNRNQWIDFVEANGGTFHSAPKENTSFMIGDAGASSSKAKKAKALGVSFMTPDEFTRRFGG